MRTYLKYAVNKLSKVKAKKFNLTWDNNKKAWYTNNIEEYHKLKEQDNIRIMKSFQRAEEKRINFENKA